MLCGPITHAHDPSPLFSVLLNHSKVLKGLLRDTRPPADGSDLAALLKAASADAASRYWQYGVLCIIRKTLPKRTEEYTNQ